MKEMSVAVELPGEKLLEEQSVVVTFTVSLLAFSTQEVIKIQVKNEEHRKSLPLINTDKIPSVFLS